MDMDKLKPFLTPVVALLVVLGWFFVVQPMLDQGALDEPAGDAQDPAPAEAAVKTEGAAVDEQPR